jgi:hypothetical protein
MPLPMTDYTRSLGDFTVVYVLTGIATSLPITHSPDTHPLLTRTGAWLIHPVIILMGKVLIDSIPNMTASYSWTIINLGYVLVSPSGERGGLGGGGLRSRGDQERRANGSGLGFRGRRRLTQCSIRSRVFPLNLRESARVPVGWTSRLINSMPLALCLS